MKSSSKRVVFLDGAMGTSLSLRGFDPTPVTNIENSEQVRNVSLSFIRAGSEIIQANTFSATPLKFKDYERVNSEGVRLAREAIELSGKKDILIAGSVGPTGRMVKPVGDLSFDEALEIFSKQISVLKASGADILLIETMDDIQEMRAALLAAKESAPDLKVISTMTFALDGRTSTGTPPEAAAAVMDSLGADVIGVNCSFGPDKLADVLSKMRRVTKKPLAAQANAGLPVIKDGETIYPLIPKEFARLTRRLLEAGASYIGGCCGTTPEHISAVIKELGNTPPPPPPKEVPLIISSRTEFVEFGDIPVLIGERINFIARPKVGESETSLISEARKQIKGGADALDVALGKSEKSSAEVIALLSSKTNAPLVIDSQNPDAVEAAVREYPGVMLLNSISAEKEKLKRLLPLASHYGMPFIGLCADDKGIALEKEDKKRIASRLIEKAREAGIDPSRVIIDPLAISVSSDLLAPSKTLESIEELGLKTVLGISNISAGMPERALLNQVFSSLAVSRGISALIVNPLDADLVYSVAAAALLSARDSGARNYLKLFTSFAEEFKFESPLSQAVLDGEREKALSEAAQLLKNSTPLEMINKHIIPALDKVGEYFNSRVYFLPQLIESARAAEEAVRSIPEGESPEPSRSKTVIIATVEGDVHDIGKNLVSLMLRNHSFRVIDLGVDVASSEIIRTAQREDADLIALSSLMTTTSGRMNEVTELLKKKNLDIPVLIGGAAVTDKFARKIGAGYSRDAVSAVRAAKKLTGE